MNAQEIKLGQKIHCILYGGRDGIVTAIHGQQSPKSCKVVGSFVHFGGSAKFDIHFDDGSASKQLSESIIRGVQWRIYDEIATPEEMIAAIENHVATVERKEEEKKQASIKREQDRQTLIKEYNYLKQNPESGGKGAAQNIRTELKRLYPGVKFSVKSSYNSVNISWTDGPTEKEINILTGKYEEGGFDAMTDCYNYSSTAFNDVFGGCRYVFTRREYSDSSVVDAITAVFTDIPGNLADVPVPSPEEYNSGRLYNVIVPHLCDSLQTFISRQLAETQYI